MAKNTYQLPDSDVLDEKYKGPNAAVAVAGEAYYAHIWMAIVGLVVGGALTYMLPNTSKNIVGKLRTTAEGWVEHDHFLPRWTGKTIHSIFGTGAEYSVRAEAKSGIKIARNAAIEASGSENHILEGFDNQLVYKEKGFGFWLLDHTIGAIPSMKQHIIDATKNDEKISMSVTSGGLLGILGFTVVPWLYALKGAHNAHQGKDQFKRAQTEVKELREDLQFVEEKNTELRKELRETKESRLHISKDETPDVKEMPVATHTIHASESDERGAAHTGHTHHTDRHISHSKSHADHVREQKTAHAEQTLGA